MATPKHKNSCLRSHGIYNCGRHFLGHHYNTQFVSSMPCSKEEDFERSDAFSLYD